MSELPFPRHSARTLRFSLGAPRNFSISPDGQRVVFVRSGSGTDRTGRLFELELNNKSTREIVNPLDLLKSGDEKISVEEQARRERAREAAAGITNYSSDTNLKKIAFTLSGNLYVANLEDGKVLQWPAQEPVIDPQFAPDGSAVGYINPSGEMRVSDGVNDRAIFTPEKADVYYGQAEFVASEEMDRMHGFWWSSDSKYLLVERFDESGVEKIWISDPANPENEPRSVRYPKVGTPNVVASLFAHHLESKSSQEIKWDKEHEYLVSVNSGAVNKPPLLMTIDRAQRHAHIRAINLSDGTSSVIAEMRDPAWITLVSGSPQWGPAGQLITTFDSTTTRHLAVDGNPVTPEGLQVDRIVHIDRNGITFEGTFEPTSLHVYWYGWGGELEEISKGDGVHMAKAAADTLLLLSRSLDYYGAKVEVIRDGMRIEIESFAQKPEVDAKPELLNLGERELRSALLLPQNQSKFPHKNLPLLVDPYGGPSHLRNIKAKNAFAEAQWIANLGFAVLITDGRGTPNRGPEWEKAVLDDLSAAPLADQADAVTALFQLRPGLIDPEKVGIRGWSFGGYLAGLAALRRPDIFKCAIIGAPVTDFRFYDTYYTERFLGAIADHKNYEQSSLLPDADKLSVPVMIIHGLADDNVLVANSLHLSSALLAAGKAHEVLPLTGVTHMTSQEVVAENLMHLELDFLKRSLKI